MCWGAVLTSREREILALIALGKANKEIAGELGIAEDTVKRHVSNILQKFALVTPLSGVTNPFGALRHGTQ